MDWKIFALLGIVAVGVPLATALFSFSYRARDIGFFLLVFGTVFTTRVDLNAVSREWYRGSTRGFEISLLDILAMSLTCAMLLRSRRGARGYWPGGLGPMLLYLLVCFFSVAICSPKLFAMFELLKVVRGVIIFFTAAMFVRSERELRIMIWAVACVVCYEGLLSLKMRYIDHVYRIEGSFEHPNSLSMFMVLCAPVLYAATMSDWSRALRRVCLCGVGLAMASVILTVSRTGVATVGLVLFLTAAGCFSFRLNTRNIIVTGVVLSALIGGVIYAWPTLMQRFNEASMKDEYGSGRLMNRGSYLRLAGMIRRDHFFGIGLNNWSYWVSNRYGPRMGLPYTAYTGTDYPPDQEVHSGSGVDASGQSLDAAQAPPAHNLGALTLGELGVPGLIVFGLVWLRWLHMGSSFLLVRPPNPLRRIGVGIFFGTCAVLFQSWTEWEYRQTPIMFMFHLVLGTLAALYMIKRRENRMARAERRRERQTRVTAQFAGA